MARLGDFIREECHPLGASGARELRLIGVSNEHGLHPSSRDASDDLSRYQRIDRDWFAYNPMRVNVGSIGFADDDSKVGFTSPDYVVFSCRAGLLPAYLLHFLKSDYGLEAVANQCSGAVRKRLYFAGLAEIELPIPSVEQQQEVVRHLDEAKAAVRFICEENSDRHELPKLKQAILQEAITGRLTSGWRAEHPDEEPASQLLARIQAEKKRLIAAKKLRPEKSLPPVTDDGVPFAIPECWKWCQFGDVLEHTFYGPRFGKDEYVDDGIPTVRTTDMSGGSLELLPDVPRVKLNDPKKVRLYTLRENDILITRTGSIGVMALFAGGYEAFPSAYLIRCRLMEESLGSYIFKVLQAPLGQEHLGLNTKTGTRPNINSDSIVSIPIPLPPLREQTEIVTRVEGLMERCRELETEIARSRIHAAALLQAVLREAFAPSTATPAETVAPIAQPTPPPSASPITPPRKKLNQHFARAVLSAEIVHQLHSEPTFGRVKHQKIFHLCEHIARIEEIAGQYHREAAGPLDNRLIYTNEAELNKQQWYREVPRESHGHAYVALPKAGAHEKYLASFAEEQVGVIRRLIDLMRKWDTDRCEIFCTAYAAWNDLVLWKREPSEDAILHEILERWNPAKRRFPRERWQAALKWMREHDYTPTGFGKPTAKP